MSLFSCVVIGNESLLIQCAEMILRQGHRIEAVVTQNPDIDRWATGHGLRIERPGRDLAARLGPDGFDWLFSIANLRIIPDDVLALAAKGAINFHDGPLPLYAGLNAPVWALINREPTHGITWHMIEGGIDEGDILEQRRFDLDPEETALSLNTKCYAAALDAFEPLLASLRTGTLTRHPQDLSRRGYFARDARPAAAALLDFRRPAEDLIALVRGLDHGAYWNPLTCPKIEIGGRILLIGAATPADPNAPPAAPGTLLALTPTEITVATATQAITLSRLTAADGAPARPDTLATPGDILPPLDPARAAAITQALAATLKHEFHWRDQLRASDPADLPRLRDSTAAPLLATRPLRLPENLAPEALTAALGALIFRIGDKTRFDLARHAGPNPAPGILADWTPLPFDGGERIGGTTTFAQATAATRRHLDRAATAGPFALDLAARDPALGAPRIPAIGISLDTATLIPGTALTLARDATGATLLYDTNRLSPEDAETVANGLETLTAAAIAAPDTALIALPLLSSADLALLDGWNDTAAPYDRDLCVHQHFEAQVARAPEAIAVAFEDQSLTYAELDARANRVAHVLRAMGIGPDVLVGLCMPRSLDLLIGALAIFKAGGAYVPIDPAYPADRVALYISDSAAPVILTRSDLAPGLPAHAAQTLLIDTDPRIKAAPATAPAGGAGPDNLAYVIFTSGSTGRPKGVMIEHRNVSNFFTGMDARLSHDPAGVWLAVTSLSFDISVLELFYTLARGFKIVLSSDENRALVSSGTSMVSDTPMDFSLFYWGNDDGPGARKYELLLEGAKFADRNGFRAVWTPERHFHAFGGPYPNPSVTGAAVAAVTRNLDVRAGSCVAPLHHTARIAEEWAVIDNLTNGRAGLAIASGWQPDDFVLCPENTPPANKPAMLKAIDTLRRLWRGEPVAFPTATGAPFEVVTQPRPVSTNLPIWVTTAGNPDTWREAGSIGAHVLTHLLGQSVDEVADKILIYHQALRAAGHDPADFKVTLMLHTFVGVDRDTVRETAREPMKAYLRSAAALIKQYAWAFPAFKKPVGAATAMDLDLRSLTDTELDAILDFAFQRYFDDSGLFGTIEDCLIRVEQLKRIGVSEIACLIDYGISTAEVLAGLVPLAEVLRRSNTPTEVAADDFSIAGQILRHGVTHLQCTPSMARMICLNDESRAALGRVRHLMLGGEPLPGALVAELGRLTGARIENMYGPTETTIWSSTERADSAETTVNIGLPIANTRFHVLDPNGQPLPIGIPGELHIGGDGVARGYWQRPDLTAERFLPDPFVEDGRMYRTGDTVARRADGRLDFFGRADYQVKIRGHRIELGEIEAVLDSLPAITQAIVLARTDTPGDTRLVAYVTTTTPTDEATLRTHLRGLLPEHMVPAHVVMLDSFPLTPNRKVDRNALPAPRPTQAPRVPSIAATDLEQRIAAIWSKILGVQDIGPKDNFFALGGHSLLAVQAHREIRAALDTPRLTITDIFRFPVLSALAAHLDDRPAEARGTAETSGTAERAETRAAAMSQRRQMRANRLSHTG